MQIILLVRLIIAKIKKLLTKAFVILVIKKVFCKK